MSICLTYWLSYAVNTITLVVPSFDQCGLSVHPAHSPFRVISMRCRNVQISSFSPQHIRSDYPQAACLSTSSATTHQTNRSTPHLTSGTFAGFSSVSQPSNQVSQETCLLPSCSIIGGFRSNLELL